MKIISSMTEQEKQERADSLYEKAMNIIDREWMDAGMSREQLAQSEQLAALLERLVGSGRCVESVLAEWQGKTADEILREYASASK